MSLNIIDLSVDLADKSIIRNVSFQVGNGEVVAVLGPSGSGKTTLLRAIAGLAPTKSGRVLMDGHDITSLPSFRRGIGYMFQDHALFPHRNVAENVEFGLRMAKVRKSERVERSNEVLALVGLGGFRDRNVASLSGGERQRVALARAIATRPSVVLLDEPFSSLDRALRERLWEDLLHVLSVTNTACIHVTHDHVEALRSGDRLVVMDAGDVVQEGTPNELWRTPNTEAVGRIVGPLNAVVVQVVDTQTAVTPWGELFYPPLLSGAAPAVGPGKLLARPDALEVLPDAPQGDHEGNGNLIEATVVSRNFMGTHALIEVVLKPRDDHIAIDLQLLVLDTALNPSQVGQQVYLRIRERSITISAN